MFGGISLGELIEILETLPPELVVERGFGRPHSWRGAYSELAFEPEENVTVRHMLDSAKGAIGSTYTGWKGGTYTMSLTSECHLAHEGSTGEPITLALLREWASRVTSQEWSQEEVEVLEVIQDELANQGIDLRRAATFLWLKQNNIEWGKQ